MQILNFTCYLMARAPTTNAPTVKAAIVAHPLPILFCLAATVLGGGSSLMPSLIAAWYEKKKKTKGEVDKHWIIIDCILKTVYSVASNPNSIRVMSIETISYSQIHTAT